MSERGNARFDRYIKLGQMTTPFIDCFSPRNNTAVQLGPPYSLFFQHERLAREFDSERTWNLIC